MRIAVLYEVRLLLRNFAEGFGGFVDALLMAVVIQWLALAFSQSAAPTSV